MLRRVLVLVFVVGLLRGAFAQRHDNVWVIGHGGEGMVFNFTNDTLKIDSAAIEMHHYSANASICDSLGNLLFYTNGGYIANTNNVQMENSQMDMGLLSPGQPYGPNTPQIVLMLPSPENSSQYYLFYKALTSDQNGMNRESHLYYLLIDMTLDNGLGGIIEKDVLLLDGVYLDWGEITACRHANGRDWWILQAESDTNRYFRFLLTPNGVIQYGNQELGVAVPSGLGQAVFSPSGGKYARLNLVDYNSGNFVDIYDFDRCSGLLSNQIHFNYADSAASGGVAISPNSRFLYVSSMNYLYQYDLEAPDVVASKVVVGVFDYYVAPWFYSSFYQCQLGPDGRIYICSLNGVNVMSVINQPDEKGLACDFKQHSIQLPTINAFSMPNFPNFRLGRLEGSPCDTIEVSAITEPKVQPGVLLSPNPATGWAEVQLPDGVAEASFVLRDVAGRVVHVQHLSGAKSTVPLEDIAPGLYFYEVRDNSKLLGSGKLVVAR